MNFLSLPPYATIFRDKKEISDLLSLSETVHLSIPILQSLDCSKQHDSCTYTHVLMVFALSTLLVKDLTPDYEKCIRLAATGPAHDIGKICVPLNILKKTPLTKTERGFPTLLFRMFRFVDAPFDLADLLGDGNLFGTDLRTLPQGLAAPRAILVIQESDPFLRALIS